jgi:prophage regulatory protein
MTMAGEGGGSGGRFVRMKEAVHLTGLSQATINRLHRAGKFPPKRQLTQGCTGWRERDIQAWAAEREEVPRRS